MDHSGTVLLSLLISKFLRGSFTLSEKRGCGTGEYVGGPLPPVRLLVSRNISLKFRKALLPFYERLVHHEELPVDVHFSLFSSSCVCAAEVRTCHRLASGYWSRTLHDLIKAIGKRHGE